MGFNQIKKQQLDQVVQIRSKHNNQLFQFFSDIVYRTEIYDIPIEKVIQDEQEFIYFLDMKGLCQNNQRILNNFSVLRSQQESIVCLLVFEQNQYSIVFP